MAIDYTLNSCNTKYETPVDSPMETAIAHGRTLNHRATPKLSWEGGGPFEKIAYDEKQQQSYKET